MDVSSRATVPKPFCRKKSPKSEKTDFPERKAGENSIQLAFWRASANTGGRKLKTLQSSESPTAHAAAKMANAAMGLTWPTHSMKTRVGSSTSHSDHCEPTQSAMEIPMRRIRFQFHNTTSRGAYIVCAAAMPVKTRPNAPQAPTISGWTWLERVIAMGEKQ